MTRFFFGRPKKNYRPKKRIGRKKEVSGCLKIALKIHRKSINQQWISLGFKKEIHENHKGVL